MIVMRLFTIRACPFFVLHLLSHRTLDVHALAVEPFLAYIATDHEATLRLFADAPQAEKKQFSEILIQKLWS
jgi:hypothetical protein